MEQKLKSHVFWTKVGQFFLLVSVLPVTGVACGWGNSQVQGKNIPKAAISAPASANALVIENK